MFGIRSPAPAKPRGPVAAAIARAEAAAARRFAVAADHNAAREAADQAAAAIDVARAEVASQEQQRLMSATLKQQRSREIAKQRILDAISVVLAESEELVRLDDECAQVGIRHPSTGIGGHIGHLAQRIRLTASG